MDAVTTAGFLLMGFTGSLHCAGMCGPIVWMMPFRQAAPFRRWTGIALYHIGRIAAYCLLGTLAFGVRHAVQPQWQQAVSLASGALLLVVGIASFFRLGARGIMRPVSNLVLLALGKIAGRGAVGWLGVTGFLNGLLPCGMVCLALAAAMKTPDTLRALGAMTSFGLGTVPMLVAVTVLRRRIRFSAGRWVPAIMLAFGLLLMLRGANLGIPYVSPARMETTQAAIPVLKCCHP